MSVCLSIEAFSRTVMLGMRIAFFCRVESNLLLFNHDNVVPVTAKCGTLLQFLNHWSCCHQIGEIPEVGGIFFCLFVLQCLLFFFREQKSDVCQQVGQQWSWTESVVIFTGLCWPCLLYSEKSHPKHFPAFICLLSSCGVLAKEYW